MSENTNFEVQNAECVNIGLPFQRSRTPLDADWYFEVQKSFRGGLLSGRNGPQYFEAQNSNSKQTDTKPRLYSKMKDILRSRKLGVLLTPISKVCSFLERYKTSKVYGFWTSFWIRFQRLSFLTKMLTLLWFCGFEGLKPLLRQTSYLKAHGFLDANKRWERIKVRGSKRKVEKRQKEEPPKLDFKGLRLSRRLLIEF
ncbi:hypothetical protein RclHR1_21930004 [Rhizophagus clarus]|uniref:Uncharacterized protein n=1 Tax=Rhizophagus clarus TaxID=94130 RepID=A0A2Z6RMH5_9GLOM|nr:hypothetical protein RclHR1_21930004 [Rhizophagus clarus]